MNSGQEVPSELIVSGGYPNDECGRTGLVRVWSKLTGVRSTTPAI
jgi:hypothetical protein